MAQPDWNPAVDDVSTTDQPTPETAPTQTSNMDNLAFKTATYCTLFVSGYQALRLLGDGVKWAINHFGGEKAQAAAPSPSVNNRLDRLEGDIDEIRQNQGQMQETLNSLSLPNVA